MQKIVSMRKDGALSIKKINNLLRNFEPSTKSTGEFREYIYSFQIPWYMIVFVLSINKFPTYTRSGKSMYAYTLRYKKVDFMLEDIRGYKCKIYSTQKNNTIELLSKQIKTKLMMACDILDGTLSKELMQTVKAGNFFINNSYIHLRRHFNRLTDDLNRQLDRSKMDPDVNELADFLNLQYKSILKVEEICFSILNVFYSLTDLIFIMFDIMEDNDPTWEKSSKFMHLSWNEKFKKVLDVKNDQIKFLHDKLLDFKNSFRNPFSHGIVGEFSLLVPLEVVGLIPLSYKKFLSGDQLSSVDPQRAKEIVKFTEEFLNFLENNRPYNFYMKYLSYSLPIPIERQSLEELKAEMTDMDNFVKFVESKAQFQNMLDNFDY